MLFLDDLPLGKVRAFELALLKHYRDEHPEVRDELATTRKMSDVLDTKLRQIVKDFKAQFVRTAEKDEASAK